MPTFSYPVNVKTRTDGGPGPLTAMAAFQTTIDVGKTGTAAGVTVLPLVTAPAGSRIYNVILEIVDPFDNVLSNTNVQIGVQGAPDRIMSPVSVNTVGRRVYAPTTAQISNNAKPFENDTEIRATVSINTSAVSTGKAYVTIVLM